MDDDVVFNDIAERFEQDIYGSSKGYIRWQVLWDDLIANLPPLSNGGLNILDVGGGAGRMSLAIAELGHQVTMVEPSAELMAKARATFAKAGLSGRIVTAQVELQRFVPERAYDVIFCHAVLEWFAQPKEALGQVASWLAPSGNLSLLFYNRNAALFKRILGGDFEVALADKSDTRLETGWGQPCRPLLESTVREWLDDFQLVVQTRAGIRIFHDYLQPEHRNGEALESLLAVERRFKTREPFASVAQHIHLICNSLR